MTFDLAYEFFRTWLIEIWKSDWLKTDGHPVENKVLKSNRL